MIREAYLETLNARLEAWGSALAQLETKTRAAPAAVLVMYVKQLAACRHHLEDVARQCAAIQAAADDWQAHQQTAEDACDRMTLAEIKMRNVHPEL